MIQNLNRRCSVLPLVCFLLASKVCEGNFLSRKMCTGASTLNHRGLKTLSGGASENPPPTDTSLPETNGNHPPKPPTAFLPHSGVSSLQRNLQTLLENTENLKARASKAMDLSFQQTKHILSRFLSTTGPAALAFFAAKTQGLTLISLYTFCLLGSSVGFYLFLYFISIGYALGLSLPALMALLHYRHVQFSNKVPTLLVFLWGIRMACFLAWREYINWPALYYKIRQVDYDNAPPFSVKVICWIVYSFVYLCMFLPCWVRLERHEVLKTFPTVAVAIQVIGLFLESVADYQKSTFKASKDNRYEWCRIGLWRYSTHPNYAGEFIFWLGTLLSGVVAVRNVFQLIGMLIGLAFITIVMQGAIESADQKSSEKYGPDFVAFRDENGVFGPRWWRECKNDTNPELNHPGSSR